MQRREFIGTGVIIATDATPRCLRVIILEEAARSLPRGSPERNERLQIASSLRSLFQDRKWMDIHSVEGSP
jgi:hypothetical protein